MISSHSFDATHPPADPRSGKRAPAKRKAPTATGYDAKALYTSFERGCDHLSSLSPSRLNLHMHHSRLAQSQDRETDRRAFPPAPSCSAGALLTTPSSFQGGIWRASCLWRRTAASPLGIAGILVVYRFHLLMYIPLSAVINASHRLCRRHPRPGGRTRPDPPKRYADVAFSGEAPLAYRIPIAIYSTNEMSPSATTTQLALYTESSGELICTWNCTTALLLNRS